VLLFIVHQDEKLPFSSNGLILITKEYAPLLRARRRP
jgi:hypothetical protein